MRLDPGLVTHTIVGGKVYLSVTEDSGRFRFRAHRCQIKDGKPVLGDCISIATYDTRQDAMDAYRTKRDDLRHQYAF